jgi:ABC-type nitrate/sulfonate/bicarbonate transport system substrate-binding protein
MGQIVSAKIRATPIKLSSGCISAALFLVFILLPDKFALALDEVKVHVSTGRSLNALVFKFAEEKGFYKENGLRVLAIAAPLQTGIVGLIGESFDFSQILGSGSATILKGGAPLKIVMAFDQRPLTWMYGAKGIRNMGDLRGKIVASSTAGGAFDQMTGAVLKKSGLDPQKDVQLRIIISQPARLTTLLAGQVQATHLSGEYAVRAKSEGLTSLIFYGDHFEYATGGVVVREKTLTERPEFVRQFLRGTVKALLHLKSPERQKEVVKEIAEYMKIKPVEASELYTGLQRTWTVDGTLPRDTQQSLINFQRNELKVEKEVPSETIYDFSLLRSVLKDLR